MKRIVSAILILTVILSFSACVDSAKIEEYEAEIEELNEEIDELNDEIDSLNNQLNANQTTEATSSSSALSGNVLDTGVTLGSFIVAYNEVIALFQGSEETRSLILDMPVMSLDTMIVSQFDNGFYSYHYIYEYFSISVVADENDYVYGATVISDDYYTAGEEDTQGAYYSIIIAELGVLTGFFDLTDASAYDEELNNIKNVEGADGLLYVGDFILSRTDSLVPCERMTAIIHLEYPTT